MKGMSRPLNVARAFARSLDKEAYAETAACLAPDCRYTIGGKTHVGPAAIIASYRNGDWAAATLDEVRYESAVRPGVEGTAVVEFVDHLLHAGVCHTHRCEQHLRFDDDGRIAAITHVDLPGEQAAVAAFLDRTGISRP